MSCIVNLGSSSYDTQKWVLTNCSIISASKKNNQNNTTTNNNVQQSQHQQIHNPYVPNHHSAPAKRQGAFASANTIQTAVNGRPSNHLGLGTTPRMNNLLLVEKSQWIRR
jgi:hypothetical protein